MFNISNYNIVLIYLIFVMSGLVSAAEFKMGRISRMCLDLSFLLNLQAFNVQSC